MVMGKKVGKRIADEKIGELEGQTKKHTNKKGVMDKAKCNITEHFEDGAPGPGLYVAVTPSSAVTDTRPVFF